MPLKHTTVAIFTLSQQLNEMLKNWRKMVADPIRCSPWDKKFGKMNHFLIQMVSTLHAQEYKTFMAYVVFKE